MIILLMHVKCLLVASLTAYLGRERKSRTDSKDKFRNSFVRNNYAIRIIKC